MKEWGVVHKPFVTLLASFLARISTWGLLATQRAQASPEQVAMHSYCLSPSHQQSNFEVLIGGLIPDCDHLSRRGAVRYCVEKLSKRAGPMESLGHVG